MKKIISFLLLFHCALFGALPEKTLQTFLSHGKSGDYIVAKSGKLFNLIHIRSINDKTLLLEEISGPNTHVKGSWASWVKNKAPGHTSWSMIEIDLETGQVLECFSFSRNAHVQITKKESLLATILQLPLNPVSSENRRRLGPPPMEGEADFRKIWNPKIIIDGKQVEDPQCDVFETTWPKDGSELEGRQVTLYFDAESRLSFPCWIELETSHITGQFHVIDSGKNLSSPHRTLPRRSPQFIGEPKKTDSGLLLTLKSPRYFHDFSLFAVDVTEDEKEILPIYCTVQLSDGETVLLNIQNEDLSPLIPKHRYQWVVVPVGFDDTYSAASRVYLR